VFFRRGSLPRKICVAVLKLPARAHRGQLAALLPEIRPLDAPQFVFRSVDSMVMDAVYWVWSARATREGSRTSGPRFAAVPAWCWKSAATSACSP
jgi:hypothetical protein